MDSRKIECKICCKMLCLPISTTCGHNYCQPCVQELIRTTISTVPRCPVCKDKLYPSYEVNRLLESVLEKHWPAQYSSRLKEPKIRLTISLYSIWIISILKTTKAISMIILPLISFALLCNFSHKIPRIAFKILNIIMRISSYKSTSYFWQLIWAIMHMIIKYLEATSVLSNIAN